MSWGIHEKHGLTELEILEYRHEKLSDHLWRIEESHDAQLKALATEITKLRAIIEELKAAQQRGENSHG
ncbi:MAG: hypothetical protein EOM03_15860 [Clostridia bacterium]|nr:hypothetical protein [Clostridia bacterium]